MAKWPFSGLKPKLAQNLTFLDWQIDSIDFLGGPKAFLELGDGQLTTLRGMHHDFWKMPKTLHPYCNGCLKLFKYKILTLNFVIPLTPFSRNVRHFKLPFLVSCVPEIVWRIQFITNTTWNFEKSSRSYIHTYFFKKLLNEQWTLPSWYGFLSKSEQPMEIRVNKKSLVSENNNPTRFGIANDSGLGASGWYKMNLVNRLNVSSWCTFLF